MIARFLIRDEQLSNSRKIDLDNELAILIVQLIPMPSSIEGNHLAT